MDLNVVRKKLVLQMEIYMLNNGPRIVDTKATGMLPSGPPPGAPPPAMPHASIYGDYDPLFDPSASFDPWTQPHASSLCKVSYEVDRETNGFGILADANSIPTSMPSTAFNLACSLSPRSHAHLLFIIIVFNYMPQLSRPCSQLHGAALTTPSSKGLAPASC
ncbi:hypothetical protein BC827DRAFT_1273070 [Russula dissimulans]|nr:hypothetical protein BC827DRAFT_1273070 [Russula dissimulans]